MFKPWLHACFHPALPPRPQRGVSWASLLDHGRRPRLAILEVPKFLAPFKHAMSQGWLSISHLHRIYAPKKYEFMNLCI